MATIRVNVNDQGQEANADSDSPSISANGRYLAYSSRATNLVAGETNGTANIFLYDTLTKKTTLISVDTNGLQGNDTSELPTLSSDGRYIAYSSYATNLAPGDANDSSDVFLYDTITKKTTQVSVNSTGTPANKNSFSPAISGNGRYIAYESEATNLVPGDTNNSSDVFLYDTITKKTTQVSINDQGIKDNYSSYLPTISNDGRYIAYVSNPANLVPGDSDYIRDIFLYDTITKKTTQVNVNSALVQANGSSYSPTISGNGRYVAYSSSATNLVPGDDNNSNEQIFVYDTLTKKTTCVSVNSTGVQANGHSFSPTINKDGRYVAYYSEATNLVPWDDYKSNTHIFVYDTVTKKTNRLSIDTKGIMGDGNSYFPALTGDGSYVAYVSEAKNLVGKDINDYKDIFLSDVPDVFFWNTQAGRIGFSSSTYYIDENGTPVKEVILNRIRGSQPTSCVLQLTNQSAIAPQDYTNSSITVTFAEGQMSATVAISLVNDQINEPNETLKLTLTNLTNGANLGPQTTAILTIIGNTAQNLSGTPASDELYGGVGNDSLTAKEGNDTLNAGEGNNSLNGGSGEDELNSFGGNDSLFAEQGSDTLRSGNGSNSLNGGAGNDSLQGGIDNDLINGGEGSDSLEGGWLDLPEFDSLDGWMDNDSIHGGGGNDLIDVGAGDNFVQGGTGDDLINGSFGNDTLIGGPGNDSLDSGFLSAGMDNDYIEGEAGNDKIYLWSADYTVDGGAGNDTCVPLAGGNYTVDGGAGNDSLSGSENDNLLQGGEGLDTIYGGDGNEEVRADLPGAIAIPYADLVFLGIGNDKAWGGSGNDSIWGEDGDDTIWGEEGNDYLESSEGNDSLITANGNDSLYTGAGNDLLFSGNGNDLLFSGNDNDFLASNNGNDFLVAENGNDSLIAGEGNDTLLGLGGQDVLNAGLGADHLKLFGNGIDKLNDFNPSQQDRLLRGRQ